MKLRRLRKNIKAISPIISVLLMIAVAVVAALVTYAWVMGYIGFTTNKTGKAIQIQSVALSGTNVVVYVQNVGDSTDQSCDATMPLCQWNTEFGIRTPASCLWLRGRPQP